MSFHRAPVSQLVPIVVEPSDTAARDAVFSLNDAKRNAIAESDEDDAALAGFIRTAFDWLQPPSGVLRYSIAPQTLRLSLPCWPFAMLELPCGPVRSIESVKYFDEQNAEQTLSASEYFLDDDSGTLIFKDTFDAPEIYTRPGAVRITYVAGKTPELLSENIRTAISMCALHWLENREAATTAGALNLLPLGVDDLLFGHRFR